MRQRITYYSRTAQDITSFELSEDMTIRTEFKSDHVNVSVTDNETGKTRKIAELLVRNENQTFLRKLLATSFRTLPQTTLEAMILSSFRKSRKNGEETFVVEKSTGSWQICLNEVIGITKEELGVCVELLYEEKMNSK